MLNNLSWSLHQSSGHRGGFSMSLHLPSNIKNYSVDNAKGNDNPETVRLLATHFHQSLQEYEYLHTAAP